MSSQAVSSKGRAKGNNGFSHAINSSERFSESCTRSISIPDDENGERWSNSMPLEVPLGDKTYKQWVSMPSDAKSAISMFGKSVLSGNARALKYMFNSGKNKRCIFQTTVMLLGKTGAGKSSVINHLLNARLASTSTCESETKSVMQYSAVTEIGKIRTKGVKLNIVDTPGFDDTEGPEQAARNLVAIKEYCNRSCALKRSCFPNVILLCIPVTDNRFMGPHGTVTRSLKILKNFRVIDGEHPNLILVMTHACSIGFFNAQKWQQKIIEKAKMFQEVGKEQVGFEPFVVYLENKFEDYGLKEERGCSVLPDDTKQPSNLFHAMIDLFQKNRDELGHATVSEFFRLSSRGWCFELTDVVRCTDANCQTHLNQDVRGCLSDLRVEDGAEGTTRFADKDDAVLTEEHQNQQAIEEKLRNVELPMIAPISPSNVGEASPLEDSTSLSSSVKPSFNGDIDRRQADAELRGIPPDDGNTDLKTILIFLLAILGIAGLAAASVAVTIYLGPPGLLPAAGAANAFAMLVAFAKASSSKNSNVDDINSDSNENSK